MALTVSGFTSAELDYKIIAETASTNTSNTNVTGTSGEIKTIACTNGSSGTVYLKIHDGSTPVVGTTDPMMILKLTSSVSVNIVIPEGLPFTTGLNFWTTQLARSTDATAPSGGNVAVTIITT